MWEEGIRKAGAADLKSNLWKIILQMEGVFHFDVVRLTFEEVVPQDLNDDMEVNKIFHKEEEITHIPYKNKSKGKDLMFKCRIGWRLHNISP